MPYPWQTVVLIDGASLDAGNSVASDVHDMGENTLAWNPFVYVDIAGWDVDPPGAEETFTVRVKAVLDEPENSPETFFIWGQAWSYLPLTRQQMAMGPAGNPPLRLPRRFVVEVTNNTGADVEAAGLMVTLEYQKVE